MSYYTSSDRKETIQWTSTSESLGFRVIAGHAGAVTPVLRALGIDAADCGLAIGGMPSFVARSLAVHIDLYALLGPEGLVLPSADGQPMRRSNFRRRVWEPATSELGMTGFRFHDLRHTAATLAAASGTSLKALMARIGHSSAAALSGTST